MTEPVRIVHASQLRLGQLPRPVGVKRGITSELLRDCTLKAFRQLVDRCLASPVDLLLITGAVWGGDFRSPRVAQMLVDACQDLVAAERAIVFAIDDVSEFQEGLCGIKLPAGVDLLPLERETDVSIRTRNGELLTINSIVEGTFYTESRPPELSFSTQCDLVTSSVRIVDRHSALAARQTDGSPDTRRANRFRIGVTASSERLLMAESTLGIVGETTTNSDYDYIALYQSLRPRTLQIDGTFAHSPGPAQGLSPSETGSGGASYIEWRDHQEPSLSCWHIEALRWEQACIETEPDLSRDDLLAVFVKTACEQFSGEPNVPRFVRWNILSRELPACLLDHLGAQDEFLTEIDQSALLGGCRIFSQSLTWLSAAEEDEPTDSLLAEFDQHVDSRMATGRDAMRGVINELATRNGWPKSDIERFLQGAAVSRVAAETRAIGRVWLNSTSEVGS